ncbi:MAG: hypothetical protein WAV79_12000, partial [Anaerolineae bacterium]
GQGYFIHTTGDAVQRFKGLSPFAESASGYRTNASSRKSAPPLPSLLPPLARSLVSPPALITGTIEPGSGFSPTAGLTVTAWIKGRACGDGSTLVMTNGISYISYSVMVRAADEDPWSGCGVPSAVITFSLESLALSAPTPVTWNNSAATAVTLTVATAKQSNPEEPSACANLLRNGDFEQAGDWTLTTTDSTARYTTAEVHAGSRALQLGLLPNGSPGSHPAVPTFSTAYQDVRLPANAQKLTLTLWVKPGTRDSSGDYQRLLIFDLTRGGSRELWRKLENQTTWQQLNFDLTAYQGRTVRVYLEVHNDNQRLPDRSWMVVDDISLSNCRTP